MTGNDGFEEKWLKAVLSVTGDGAGKEAASGSTNLRISSDDFDAAADHVLVILKDAVSCFSRGSFGTAVFLAITALEETAKAEMMGFRAPGADSIKRGRDPLYNHSTKHSLAVRPTTFMGRLNELLGEEACSRLRGYVENNQLVGLREQGLYFQIKPGKVTTPRSAVSFASAREILLLALESADDILVGWTDKSYPIGVEIEGLIKLVAEPEPMRP